MKFDTIEDLGAEIVISRLNNEDLRDFSDKMEFISKEDLSSLGILVALLLSVNMRPCCDLMYGFAFGYYLGMQKRESEILEKLVKEDV